MREQRDIRLSTVQRLCDYLGLRLVSGKRFEAILKLEVDVNRSGQARRKPRP